MKSWMLIALATSAVVLAAGCDSRASQAPAASTPLRTVSPQPTDQPSPDSLVAPSTDPRQVVLARNAGSGTMSRPRRVRTDRSYMFYADCAGGTQIRVMTSDRSTTPVPCTGFTSRMRFIAGPRAETYRVIADSSTVWAITWTDYDPSR